jgi:hypothetical protein
MRPARMIPAACLALGACSGGLSSGDVRVRTDRNRYLVPDVAQVAVRNQWGEDLYLSSCAYPERREQTGWVGPVERVCPTDLVRLAPGEEHRFILGLNQGTAPGVYRLRVPVTPQGNPFEAGDESFVSNIFTVLDR